MHTFNSKKVTIMGKKTPKNIIFSTDTKDPLLMNFQITNSREGSIRGGNAMQMDSCGIFKSPIREKDQFGEGMQCNG